MTTPGPIACITAVACIWAAMALACCAVDGGAVYGALSVLAIAAGAILLDSGDPKISG